MPVPDSHEILTALRVRDGMYLVVYKARRDVYICMDYLTRSDTLFVAKRAPKMALLMTMTLKIRAQTVLPSPSIDCAIVLISN